MTIIELMKKEFFEITYGNLRLFFEGQSQEWWVAEHEYHKHGWKTLFTSSDEELAVDFFRKKVGL
jgi:hypothetical protein